MSGTIVLAGYEWYVLRQIGDKYFLVTENPIFMGYYAFEACPFAESRLFAFLEKKFVPYMERFGVDTNRVTNVSILTLGQFRMYVQGRVPNTSVPYMTQTPHSEQPDCITAIDTDGNPFPSGVRAKCGIRPCLFIDKSYADSLSSEPLTPVLTASASITEEPRIKSETETIPSEPEPLFPVATVPAEIPSETTRNVAVSDESVENGTVPRETIPDETVPTETVEKEIAPNETVKDATVSDKSIPNETASDGIIEDRTVPDEMIEDGTVPDEMIKDRTVPPETIKDNAVYIFDDNFKDFGIIFDSDAKDAEKKREEFGNIIRLFAATTVADRTELDREKMMNGYKNISDRWRWRGKQ